jgi:ABC-2 type transport system ATP-binding protein
MRTVATPLRPDGGQLLDGGHDVVRQPARVPAPIGLAGQHAAVEVATTGRENLEMVARLHGLGRRETWMRAGEVVEQLRLGEIADRWCALLGRGTAPARPR